MTKHFKSSTDIYDPQTPHFQDLKRYSVYWSERDLNITKEHPARQFPSSTDAPVSPFASYQQLPPFLCYHDRLGRCGYHWSIIRKSKTSSQALRLREWISKNGEQEPRIGNGTAHKLEEMSNQ